MQIAILPDGQVQFIWDDSLAPIREMGQMRIKRVSHVEPDDDGLWWADLGPVEGPRLGPFDLRSEALAAERDWLESPAYNVEQGTLWPA